MQPPGPKSRAAKKSKTSHHRDFPTHGSTMRPAAISSTHRPTHGRRVSTSNNQSQQAAAADRVSNKPSNRHVGRHTTQSCGPASASTDQTRDITTDTHGVPTETGGLQSATLGCCCNLACTIGVDMSTASLTNTSASTHGCALNIGSNRPGAQEQADGRSTSEPTQCF